MEEFKFIGKNSFEDVNRLCSLSELELNMLLVLKHYAMQHAESTEYDSLAKEYDLKMLQAIGSFLMKDTKGQLEDTVEINLLEKVLGGCNLLKGDQKYNAASTTTEDVMQHTKMEEEQWTSAGLSEVAPDFKRLKIDLLTPKADAPEYFSDCHHILN